MMKAIVCATVCLGGMAVAADGDDVPQLIVQAKIEFQMGEFEAAAKMFEQAYRASPKEEILFDLAECHRRAYESTGDISHRRRAIDLYRNYTETTVGPSWMLAQ